MEKKNKELELERKLLKESTRLDNADTYNLSYAPVKPRNPWQPSLSGSLPWSP